MDEKPDSVLRWAPSSMMLQAGILERLVRPPATPVVEGKEWVMLEEAGAVGGGGAGFTVCCVFHELLVGEVGLVKEDLSHFRGEF